MAGYVAWLTLIVFEGLATYYDWQTMSMAVWEIGRVSWIGRVLVLPVLVGWLALHLLVPLWKRP